MTSAREEGSCDEAQIISTEDTVLAGGTAVTSCSSGDDVPIDKRIDLKQVLNAAKALKRHTELINKKLSGQLFRQDVYVLLQIVLNKIPSKAFWYPRVIPLAHPVADDQIEICLFVKNAKAVKEQIKLQNVPNVKKVIGISKLGTHYNRYEARRKLASSYDLFLVQKKVAKLIPKFLGKSFLRMKKFPIVVRARESDLRKEVIMARDSASFQLSSGPTQTIKIGLTSFTEEQICANFLKCIDPIVQCIPGKWNNIKQMSLRTHHSLSLPFFTQLNRSFLSNPHLVDDPNFSKEGNSLLEISLDQERSQKRVIQYSLADAVGVSVIKRKAPKTGIYVVKKEIDPFSPIIEEYLRDECLTGKDSPDDQKPVDLPSQALDRSHDPTPLSCPVSPTLTEPSITSGQSAQPNYLASLKTPKSSKKSLEKVESHKQIGTSDSIVHEKQVGTPTKSPSVTPEKQVKTPPSTPKKRTGAPVKCSSTFEKRTKTPNKPSVPKN